ncbi:MAG: leucine-rich repeat domain-containing protein [Candidatus Kariarchaeaceae archaeon]
MSYSQLSQEDHQKIEIFREIIGKTATNNLPLGILAEVIGFKSDSKLIVWLLNFNLPSFQVDFINKQIHINNILELKNALSNILGDMPKVAIRKDNLPDGEEFEVYEADLEGLVNLSAELEKNVNSWIFEKCDGYNALQAWGVNRPRAVILGGQVISLNLSEMNIKSSIQNITNNNFPALKGLSLKTNFITKMDFEPIIDLISLQSLNIMDNQISTLDLSPLADFHNLRRLGIGYNNINSLDLKPLEGLYNLQRITARYNMITEIDLTPLASCCNLQYLCFAFNHIENVDFASLSCLDELKEINFQFNKITDVDLKPFINLECLRRIDLSGNPLSEKTLAQAEMLKERGITVYTK